MTGPQQPRPTPAPRGDDPGVPRPSPRPRHGLGEDAPEPAPDTGQQGGYPDLRSSRPLERAERTDPGGYPDLFGDSGPLPVVDGSAPDHDAGEYASPVTSHGHDANGYADPPGTTTPAEPRRAYGEYGDPVSRGGTAIDGGPPYVGQAPDGTGGPYGGTPAPGTAAAGHGDRVTGAQGYGNGPTGPSGYDDRPVGTAGYDDRPGGAVGYGDRPVGATGYGEGFAGETGQGAGPTGAAGHRAGAAGAAGVAGAAVVDRSEEPTGPTVTVPPQRVPTDPGRRPATVAEAAAERFGSTPGSGAAAADPARPEGPSSGPARVRGSSTVRVAKDSAALTALRVVTYLLVSLSCLVFLAAVVYGVVVYLQLRELPGIAPLFGGGPFSGG
ncbi:hypothetical protein [Pseudonocardia sp. HH130630-07]|uniref:hypothetical protein n=1 Tax=Pseudonocardia sp. HH130630-07 TaxID=1690815 RepID=UPI000814EC42|nr:hypothetical protein [Pseudonocardia sp. HH130630-07]ANY07106.1 hypothetical protein AFB00_13320 [Pseudonocardia sp. HH130630-07]